MEVAGLLDPRQIFQLVRHRDRRGHLAGDAELNAINHLRKSWRVRIQSEARKIGACTLARRELLHGPEATRLRRARERQISHP